MTTYAPNFTPRYQMTYKAGGITHTIQIRGARGDDAVLMLARGNTLKSCFDAFVAADKYTDLVALSAQIALTDSDVFAPVAPPTLIVGTAVPSTFSPVQRIMGLTFSGKAPGSKARFTMFGIIVVQIAGGSVGASGVVLTAGNAAIGTVAGIATTNYHAGSGASAVFSGRATYKENDHLLRLVRKGTIT